MESETDSPWDHRLLRGGDGSRDEIARLIAVASPRRQRVGWATVELDRAERELVAAAATPTARVSELAGDAVLGATCRLLDLGNGRELVLLEPSTEGPLAAALARHGEGPVALYLEVDTGTAERVRLAGFALARPGPGPFGSQRQVDLGRRDGPFVLLAPMSADAGHR